MHLELWFTLSEDGRAVRFAMKESIGTTQEKLFTAEWNSDMPYERITEQTNNAIRRLCNELGRQLKSIREH